MSQVSGNVLPISYQYELSAAFARMLNADTTAFDAWLQANGLSPEDNQHFQVYSVSNLYVPKIHVEEDRLEINVPRVQFWVSMLPETGTREFLETQLLGKQISVGDSKSSVTFNISAIDDISPVNYTDFMEYQSLAPVVVKAVRPNGSLEFLGPENRYFAQFMVEGIIERWEAYYKRPYTGNRSFHFTLLAEPRRKAVAVLQDTPKPQKEVGYMIKFRLGMSPELQEFAYVTGVGDDIPFGFGYLELLKKTR